MSNKKEVDYTKWVALTMGDFIGACVDQGKDDFILRREVTTFPKNKDGEFARLEEIVVVPMSRALDFIEMYKPTHISKVLEKFIELEHKKQPQDKEG